MNKHADGTHITMEDKITKLKRMIKNLEEVELHLTPANPDFDEGFRAADASNLIRVLRDEIADEVLKD